MKIYYKAKAYHCTEEITGIVILALKPDMSVFRVRWRIAHLLIKKETSGLMKNNNLSQQRRNISFLT
jgi:hypothetical protein